MNTTTQVLLVGKGLSSAPSVKLSAAGMPEIVAANVVAKSNVLLSCTFNLATAVAGFYDLHLNMSGSTAIMSRAFHVLARNNAPLVWSNPDMAAIPIAPVPGFENGITVADVENNGHQEVYATNRNAYFFKFTGGGSSWSCQSENTSLAQNYNDILAADIDYDGVKELYLAGAGAANHVYQFKHNGTSYEQTADLGTASGSFLCLAYGDGNNDGDLEIYAGSADGHVHQFRFNGAAWTQNDLGQAAATAIRALVVANADSGNQFEIYAAAADQNVYQYKKDPTWSSTPIATLPGIVYGIAASDQDKDNNHIPELYAACEDKKIHRIMKTGASSWGTTEIATGGGIMYDVIAADGDSTGTERLFAANADGHVYRIWQESGQWLLDDCGSTGQAVHALAAGDGDNDNRHEIYTVAANNRAYMFKAEPLNPTPTITPTLEVTPTITATSPPSIAGFSGQIIDPKHFYVAPNPTRGVNVNFRFFLKQAAEVEIRIYTPQGSHVLTKPAVFYPQGWSSTVWNASGMANGVYFYIAEAKANGATEKIKKTICLVK